MAVTKVHEDATFFLLGRVTGTDGNPIVQSDVSSIAYEIFRVRGGRKTSIASGALVIADVVFNTLQLDARWDVDTIGYNFRWQVLSNVLTEPRTKYLARAVFTAGTNEDFRVEWEVPTR